MTSYRVYKLNPAGRIVAGEWIEAQNDAEATKTAHGFCDAATPTVELWRGAVRLAVLPCDETVAA